MSNTTLLHELIALSANSSPGTIALSHGGNLISYGELLDEVTRFSSGLMHLGIQRGERVAIYLEKRFETVIASFGATAAGGVFVPLNPLLKAEQVGYILRDCNVRVLVTSRSVSRYYRKHFRLAATCGMSWFSIRRNHSQLLTA